MLAFHLVDWGSWAYLLLIVSGDAFPSLAMPPAICSAGSMVTAMCAECVPLVRHYLEVLGLSNFKFMHGQVPVTQSL